MKYCTKCGCAMGDEEVFCTKCGTQNATQAVPPAAPGQQSVYSNSSASQTVPPAAKGQQTAYSNAAPQPETEPETPPTGDNIYGWQPEPAAAPVRPAAEKRSPLMIIIAGLLALLVLVVAIVGVLLYQNSTNSSDGSPRKHLDAAVTQEDSVEETTATEAPTDAPTEAPTEAPTAAPAETAAPAAVTQAPAQQAASPNYVNGAADPSYYGFSMGTNATVMHVNCSSVHIYPEANLNSPTTEANTLYQNDNVYVWGTTGSFSYISTDDGSHDMYGIFGYVPTKYLSSGAIVTNGDEYSYTMVKVTGSTAHVRSTPSKDNDSNVIGTVSAGDTFSVYSYDGYWYKIDYYGTVAYISHKMVTGW